ncbi:uncharacterized protein LOC132572181 isoform X15 [Heteronotia binoei]|uniref:uncharacterized protein LOC132572181 isoform X15 n=1 Tax=Heteronotia binoei TaxID=13085 RepID=UPI0029303591|nr:uncharacterized protein LOC132572181 isoform X15 [Heteronotia binoei]
MVFSLVLLVWFALFVRKNATQCFLGEEPTATSDTSNMEANQENDGEATSPAWKKQFCETRKRRNNSLLQRRDHERLNFEDLDILPSDLWTGFSL